MNTMDLTSIGFQQDHSPSSFAVIDRCQIPQSLVTYLSCLPQYSLFYPLNPFFFLLFLFLQSHKIIQVPTIELKCPQFHHQIQPCDRPSHRPRTAARGQYMTHMSFCTATHIFSALLPLDGFPVIEYIPLGFPHFQIGRASCRVRV